MEQKKQLFSILEIETSGLLLSYILNPFCFLRRLAFKTVAQGGLELASLLSPVSGMIRYVSPGSAETYFLH